MKLELNTWERLMVGEIVGQIRGDVKTIVQAMPALNALKLSDEEKEEVGLTLQAGNMTWEDFDRTWEIEIPDDSMELVKSHVSNFQGWRAIDANNLVPLIEKLGLDLNAEPKPPHP